MEDKNISHPKSSNGFLLGMVVGGALVFLIGTKKGRRVLKQISEKGAEMIEELSGIEDIESLSQEEDAGEVFEEPEKGKVDNVQKETKQPPSHNGHSIGKRFFKGIKRR